MSYPIKYVEETIRFFDWCNGTPKRTSRFSHDVFLTRKDKRIFERDFLLPRAKFRYNGPCYSAVRRRRAKSTWGKRQ